MAGIMDLIDQLTQPYQSAAGYVGQGASSLLDMLKQAAPQGASTGSALTNALNTSSDDGSVGTALAANQASAAPPSANVGNTPDDLMSGYQGSGSAAPAAPAQAAPTNVAQGGPALQQQTVDPSQVAQVDTTTGSPSASDYNADGTQASPGADASGAQSQPAGGFLGSLAGAATDAAGDPVKSKGLLSAMGDTMNDIGSKLKNMSPAASQGLLSAGMTILANNNGRNNLAQLVGEGGSAGLNAYQQVNQNRVLMAKNAMDVQHMQNQDTVAAQNAATEAWKAQHPYLTVDAGQTVVQPGSPGSPAGTIASGGVKAAGTTDVVQPDGSTMTYKTDTSGAVIPGTGVISKNPNVGPLQPDQSKTVNDASTQATKDQQAVQRTQAMLGQLQNVDIPAGLKAKGQDLWTQLTGDQTTGQVLRNQLQQQTYQNYLATWKPGIGGRLTNTDVNLLKQGMPPDTASSQSWSKFLTSYGKLQSDVADQSTRGAAFAAQNRGNLGTLQAPLTIGGMQFPAGASYQQVVMGQGGTPIQQSGQNGGNTASAGGFSRAQLIAEAQRRGLLNGNGPVQSQ